MSEIAMNSSLTPIKIGLRFEPASIVLIYKEKSKLRSRYIPAKEVDILTNVTLFAEKFKNTAKNKKYFEKVAINKLEKIIFLLQDHMKGYSLKESLARARKYDNDYQEPTSKSEDNFDFEPSSEPTADTTLDRLKAKYNVKSKNDVFGGAASANNLTRSSLSSSIHTINHNHSKSKNQSRKDSDGSEKYEDDYEKDDEAGGESTSTSTQTEKIDVKMKQQQTETALLNKTNQDEDNDDFHDTEDEEDDEKNPPSVSTIEDVRARKDSIAAVKVSVFASPPSTKTPPTSTLINESNKAKALEILSEKFKSNHQRQGMFDFEDEAVDDDDEEIKEEIINETNNDDDEEDDESKLLKKFNKTEKFETPVTDGNQSDSSF